MDFITTKGLGMDRDNYFVDNYLDFRKRARKQGYSIMYIVIPNEGSAEITVARPKIRMKKDELDELLRFFMENSRSHEILGNRSFHPVWERLIENYCDKTYFKFDLGEGAWIEAVLVKFEEVL